MRQIVRIGASTSGWLALFAMLQTGSALRAADVDYLRDVKPLLKEKCSACHGPLAQKGGLRLDSGELVRKGGDSGSAVDLEQADESELLFRVTARDDAERMPPAAEGERLTAEEIAILQEWIRTGAKSPADEEILADPRAHWAYQFPKRPPIPEMAGGPESVNPIDAFLAEKLLEKALVPAGPANRETLLRRVSLDLIGLPPTPEELHAFLADDSPDAYEKVVDRLLESPHYGERWGRHWMDVWRYSDWDGFKDMLRNGQRHIWRWRDWIVESLNADKGYDRMLVEMLAGDEIAPDDADTLRATGFLARSFSSINRNLWLEAIVEHTSKGFLGITMNCVKCHDHKYDPIPQEDYYRFRAIFEPHRVRVDRLPGQSDVMQDGLPRAFDSNLAVQTFLYIRGDEKQPDKSRPLEPAIPQIFGAELSIEPVKLPIESWYPSLRDFVEREDLGRQHTRIDELEAALSRLADESAPETEQRHAELKLKAAREELEALEARWSAERARYLGTGEEVSGKELAREAARREEAMELAAAELAAFEKEHLPAAADKKEAPAQAKAAKPKKQPAAAGTSDPAEGPAYTPVGERYPQTSSGRRTALARWIVSSDNPLTARVAVNHIWLRHFGTPLVDNVFDFGLNSPRPLHHELLDWLACEFMSPSVGFNPLDGGQSAPWQMKRLHRLIVTSRTYRLSSKSHDAAPINRQIDPDNLYYWRANVRRLEAEAIRDSVLSAAQTLDKSLGGPDIDYSEGEAVPRRSLYFRTAYEKQMQLMQVFDGASPTECYRRSESVVPQQALALANSSFTLTQSRKLARDLWATARDQSHPQMYFIRSAFERILSRQPVPEEERACLAFLERQRERLLDVDALTPTAGGAEAKLSPAERPAMRSREDLVHVLFNHNDFVTVR